jgi:hypothetical protein
VHEVRSEYEATQNGFLEELVALYSIVAEKWIALVFYAVLLVFLLLLELLVIISKSGSKCDYDKIVEHQTYVRNMELSALKQGRE